MLADSEDRTIVSSLGWVDRGAIWILETGTGHTRSVDLGGAKYLSLHRGTSNHFSAVHHYDSDRLVITAHHFDRPDEILSRCVVSQGSRGIDGPISPWEHVPRHYVAYLEQPAWSEFALVTIQATGNVALQTFDWYDDSYDKGYQGITGTTEIPGSHLLLVSVQRCSKPIVYDPESQCKVGEFALSDGHGNPRFLFRRKKAELWADDYDTIVKVEPDSWRILKTRRLQKSQSGTAQFVGEFSFNRDESICAVARPFSGDIVGLDPRSLRTRYRAKLGGQPLEVSLLSDRRVFARDWKTGDLLQGRLRRAWAA